MAVVELALLALVGASHLNDPVDCRLVKTTLTSERFASVAAAVATTASATLESSVREDREWVGGVLRDASGAYRITAGRACTGQAKVTFSVPFGPRLEVVACWHTLGADGLARDWFSRDDANLVARTGKDFYLVTPRGELKVLTRRDVASWRAEVPGTRLLDADALTRLSQETRVTSGEVNSASEG